MRPTERIQELYVHLVHGWSERIEHGSEPVYVKTVKYPALVKQLEQAGRHAPAGTGQGRNPNKSGSRPPGYTAPLDLLDEIHQGATRWHTTLHAELSTHPARTGRVLRTSGLLASIVPLCESLEHQRPSMVHSVLCDANSWVKRARIVLGYDKPLVMLADTVCGECGGGLAVATDASTDVRCVGTPEEPACGVIYPRFRWLELLEA